MIIFLKFTFMFPISMSDLRFSLVHTSEIKVISPSEIKIVSESISNRKCTDLDH